MADPTRQKSKGHGRSSAGSGHGANGSLPSDNPLIFWTTPTLGRPCIVDLTEFATGRCVTGGSESSQWGGDFTARPHLIEELAPAIRAHYSKASEGTVDQLRISLRNFWRHLDSIADFAPCQQLTDINEGIAALWVHGGVQSRYYLAVRLIVYSARRLGGMPPQVWPRMKQQEGKQNDAPSHAACKALYLTLKGVVQKIMAHWAKGDELATKGMDPRDGPKLIDGRPIRDTYADPADRATLIKALMVECVTPIPPASSFPRSVHNYDSDAPLVPGAHPESCHGIGGQLRWFYPSFEDACIFFLLFILLTGWNNQVTFDMDASNDDWWEPHPSRHDVVILRSIKNRAHGSIQKAISLTKPKFHAYQLLCTIIKRTTPLRDELRRQLAATEAAFAMDPGKMELRKKMHHLREGVRSPWLYFIRKHLGKIGWLSIDQSKEMGKVLDAVVEQANEWIRKQHAYRLGKGRAAGNPELIGKLVISDFRDAWIGYAYANSGYNWLIAKLAAGHNTLDALRDYLRKKRWHDHSEKQYRKFMDVLWAEIGERRPVDPAILRWMVEHGEITEEQRNRWEAYKDRTRMGVGCKDFQHPPKDIAPDHVEGNGCRVQRCTLCRHAVVFPDSLDGLARRMAELEHIQASIPVTTWIESSFPDEVESTEDTLTLFKQEDVEIAVEKWRKEITAGKHYVFQFEGSYSEVINGG